MIFRSTDQVNFIKVATTGQNAQNWTDTTLGPNTTYYYKLKARAETANSDYSKLVNATTLSPSDDLTASFDLTSGQLIVRGTFGNDTMSVSTTTSTVVATVNGASKIFNKLDVQRISVLGLSGNDSVQILSGVIAVNISGGEGDDTLLGSAHNDRIDGGPGDDSIKGLDGEDSLTGGEGNDTIYGQAGNDYMQGGFGNDKLVGGDGTDSILGNDGNDRLYGQGGLDTLVGGGGSNYIQQD